MIIGQHGDQVDLDNDQTSGPRFEKINRKLDKLLTLCRLVEDPAQLALLKEDNTELKNTLQWATDEVNDLRNNQNEMRTELFKFEAQSRRSNINRS